MSQTIQLYLPDEYRDKLQRIMGSLTERGIDIRDNRGHASISKTIRYLIDRELEKQENDNKQD